METHQADAALAHVGEPVLPAFLVEQPPPTRLAAARDQRYGTAAPANGSGSLLGLAGGEARIGRWAKGEVDKIGSVAAGSTSTMPTVAWIPATMLDAPKRMKHPTATLIARRGSILPDSIMRPTVATQITATVVATVPSKVPCSQPTAATTALDPLGSASDVEGGG